MSTCNHKRISHICYCLPLIPLTFPFSVKREEATSWSFNNASTVLPNSHPFPRLRLQRPPKWNSCRLHKNTHGWSSSPRRFMDIADRRLAPMEEDTTKAEDESEDHSLSERPVHDVFYVTDYPTRSLRLGRGRDGAGVVTPASSMAGQWGTGSLRKRQIITSSRSLPGRTAGRCSSLAIASSSKRTRSDPGTRRYG